MEVVSATHFVSGPPALKSRYRLVGSHLRTFLAFRGDGARRAASSEHQTRHPFAGTMNTLCLQFGMHTWTAIHAAIGLESRLHFLSELGIFSAMITGCSLAPG